MKIEKKQIKLLIFALLVFVAAILFWQQLFLLFSNNNIKPHHFLSLGIFSVIFISFLLLFFILIKDRKIIYLTILISSGFFFIFPKFNYIYLFGILFFILFLISAYERIRAEKEDRLKLSLRMILSRGLCFIVIGIALITSITYYFNPWLKFGQNETIIDPKIIQSLIKPFTGIFAKSIPFYSPEMTIDQIITVQVMISDPSLKSLNLPQDLMANLKSKIKVDENGKTDINTLIKDPDASSLMKEIFNSQKINPKLLIQQRTAMAKTFGGVELKGDETLDTIFVKLINSKLSQFIGPYVEQISIAIAVSLFFFLWFIEYVLAFVALILSQIIFIILKLCKVVIIEKVMKEGQEVAF
ncbi:MAG: hypothetical protein PHG83_01305 [Patescibacteria group bacterium]|nr:hypothetical protein [Patescibacteria group bacterium]